MGYAAWLQAVRALRRASIVEATGWTYTELDAQDRAEISAHMTYLNLKNAILAERDRLHTAQAGRRR